MCNFSPGTDNKHEKFFEVHESTEILTVFSSTTIVLPLWVIVGYCGLLWIIVGYCGLLWVIVDYCGLLLVIMDYCGLLFCARPLNIKNMNINTSSAPAPQYRFLGSYYKPLFIHRIMCVCVFL